MFFSTPLVIEIEFEEPSYTTPENGTVEVCAHVTSGQLERDVEVVLSTRPGTSTGQSKISLSSHQIYCYKNKIIYSY